MARPLNLYDLLWIQVKISICLLLRYSVAFLIDGISNGYTIGYSLALNVESRYSLPDVTLNSEKARNRNCLMLIEYYVSTNMSLCFYVGVVGGLSWVTLSFINLNIEMGFEDS